ncbi:hypothetical protein [Oceanicaulis sp.]|uniref:hypothetical protein n=1 Tax=Oceanicaulis sp. TaxID=1924941 RepID=UPI003F703F22
MSTTDHIALTAALTATLEMIEQNSRRTGRTTRMIESIKPHDAILVENRSMKKLIEHHLQRRGLSPLPTIITVSPTIRGIQAVHDLIQAHDRVHIDHHLTHLLMREWLQEFRLFIDQIERRPT